MAGRNVAVLQLLDLCFTFNSFTYQQRNLSHVKSDLMKQSINFFIAAVGNFQAD